MVLLLLWDTDAGPDIEMKRSTCGDQLIQLLLINLILFNESNKTFIWAFGSLINFKTSRG